MDIHLGLRFEENPSYLSGPVHWVATSSLLNPETAPLHASSLISHAYFAR